MSEAAKSARAAMKKKAADMTAGDPKAKVDASSWEPPEMMNTEAKTGLRPVSRRQFKKGGKVVACVGEMAPKRADRKARKSGGRANDYVNRDVKAANAEIAKPHVGGFKKGGAAKGNDGGNGARPTGGRIARKHGGKTGKGKTNINIIVGAGHGQQQPQMPPNQMGPVRPPQVAPPMPPAAAPQAMPMPMPGAGAGMPPPPMQRKSGGRVGNRRYRSFKDMDAGSGGGLGRLEKTEIQENK